MDFKRGYQKQYNENMMGDYIWGMKRESLYKHKKLQKDFFKLDFQFLYIKSLLFIISFEYTDINI